MTLNRREFVQLAAAMGASLAWGGSARASTTAWHERRDLYPEGVASGDPDPSSVILWTRRPFEARAGVVGRSPQACASLLVPLHRWRGERQPRRPNDHRAARERSAARQFRLC